MAGTNLAVAVAGAVPVGALGVSAIGVDGRVVEALSQWVPRLTVRHEPEDPH